MKSTGKRLLPLAKPDHMLIKGRGKASGNAVEMLGNMTLSAVNPAETCMDWSAQVIISGTIASVGARLMNNTVESLTSTFFECLKSELQTPVSAGSEP